MATRTGAQPAKVTRVTEDGRTYVELADVAPGFEFGPVLDTVGDLVAGERVIVTSLARDADELVIVGVLGGRAGAIDLEPYVTDEELTTALDAKVDDTDARLSDARTPTAHQHAAGDVTSGTLALARVPLLDLTKLPVAPSGNANATQVVRADDARLSNARTPTTHSHAIADLPVASSGTSSTTQVVRADDSRLSNARTPTAHSHTMSDLPAAAAALAAYPVGAVFISVVNTSPATLFGGTWASIGTGRTLVGVDTSQTEFNTVEKTGGAKTHTLSLAEIPNVTGSFQNHAGEGGSTMWAPTGVFSGSSILSGAYRAAGAVIGGAHSMINAAFNLGGGGGAHNNLQPYVTVYMWKRTA